MLARDELAERYGADPADITVCVSAGDNGSDDGVGDGQATR